MTKELFLVHGKPGSGKSTASKIAAQQLGDVYYFSIGDEIRDRGLRGKPSRYSDELKGYERELKLHLPLPPHLAALVFEECIETSHQNTIIVDGYPQFADRLPTFNDSLEKVGAKVLAVCQIEVPDELAKQRLRGRDQRSMDVPEDEAFINHRLEGYVKNVIPVIEELSQTYPIHVIDGTPPKEAVADAIASIVSTH